MKLTIGMPSYNNYQEVWFTVNALRVYQDLKDCEILIIDNYGQDLRLKKFCANKPEVKYILWNPKPSSHVVKNRIFDHGQGDFCVSMDSHIFLYPNVIRDLKNWINENPNCKDLFHGPMVYADMKTVAFEYHDEWTGNQWGRWRNGNLTDLPKDPYEIRMMGTGFFGCKRDAWQGFNEEFTGFGGGEGYIHEKHRQAGHKVICLPFLKWMHYFKNQSGVQEKPPYDISKENHIRNYIIGLTELGMDLTPIKELFGERLFNLVYKKYLNELSEKQKVEPVSHSIENWWEAVV